jgi:hypothetical protein
MRASRCTTLVEAATIDGAMHCRELVRSWRSNAGSAYCRYRLAPLVALISSNAAGTVVVVAGGRSRSGSARRCGRSLVAVQQSQSDQRPCHMAAELR